MVKKILTEAGLSKKEIGACLALIKLGLSGASDVGKEIKLPRQTVYSILGRLVELELIEQSVRRGVKQFYTDPNKLLLFLDKKRQQFEENKKVLEKEIPQLFSLRKRESVLPKIQYYEGRAGLERLFRGVLEFYKNGGEKKFFGYGINMFHEALGDFLYYFVKERGRYNVETHLFIGQGPDDFGITGPENEYGRSVRRLPMNPQQAGMYLVGDKVYLFSFKDNVGVMVENEAMATLLKNVFEDHWAKYDNQENK